MTCSHCKGKGGFWTKHNEQMFKVLCYKCSYGPPSDSDEKSIDRPVTLERAFIVED